jgi:LysR family transcriptional regulator, glycine cleavage system transcriptional activator
MKRRLPPLNWLRSFEAAARLLSFTAAGEELHLTQAAVSQHIKSLEQYLGSPLFIRLPRSLRLTEHGSTYQQRIEPVLNQLADDTDEIFGHDTKNQLVIRVNAAFSVLWLAPRLGSFMAAHPKIELRISNPVWALGEMEEGANFEIQYGRGDWPGLDVTQLTWDTLFPVCHPDHISQARGNLAAQQRIHVMGYRDGWADWCRAAGMAGFDATEFDATEGMKCDNSIMAFEMAARGVGVAIARSSLAHGKIEKGILARPFEQTVPTSQNFYLISPPNASKSPAQTAFRDWITDEVVTFRSGTFG